MRPLALLTACAALASACASTGGDVPASLATLRRTEIEAVTVSGAHRFRVWVAADDESRAQGLMFVRKLPHDGGMIFVFEEPHEAAFWMKDTFLSLDLVFIDPDGKVLSVAADAAPMSEEPIFSRGPIIAVLEVPAGTARRIGLAPGDRISLPTLPTTSRSAPAPAATSNPDRTTS